MKRLAVPILSFILGLSSASQAVEFDRAAFMRMATTTVRIEALAPDSHYNMGTGVIVAPGRVVTSCHVTGPAPSIRVLYGGLRYSVKKQRADVHNDLCMLDIPELEGAPAEVGSSQSLHLGDQVIAMGFTGGYELQFADGVVRGLHSEHGFPVIKSSTAFNSGSSGGGLFDTNGKLVGILTFRLRGTGDCYFSMPVDHFKNWIGSMEGFETPTVLDHEVPVWQAPYEKQPPFLQAAFLEMTKNWPKLESLSMDWTRKEPHSADAWLALGRAEVALQHPHEAMQALQKAVEIEPLMTEAWYALALAYKAVHQDKDYADIHHKLETMDVALATELEKGETTFATLQPQK